MQQYNAVEQNNTVHNPQNKISPIHLFQNHPQRYMSVLTT